MLARTVFDPFAGRIYELCSGLGIAVAAICAFLLARRSLRQTPRQDAKHKQPSNRPLLLYMVCYALAYLALMCGTRLLGKYMMLGISRGVNSFAGGVFLFIPAFLGSTLFFLKKGSPSRLLELAMPGLALEQMCNRIGCYLNGCCFGRPFRPGIVFPPLAPASLEYGPGTPVFPSQLVEAVVMLLCFIVMLWLHLHDKRTLPIFPIVFGASSFLLGFVSGVLRGNLLLGLDLQQWCGLFLLGCGLFFALTPGIKSKKEIPARR